MTLEICRDLRVILARYLIQIKLELSKGNVFI